MIVSEFAYLCSVMEGFGKPGAIPTIRNNPMDLKHSPHSSHEGIGPNDIGIIDTIEHGWEDADRQAQLWAERGLNLQQAIEEQTGWTPQGDVEGNNTEEYLSYVSVGLGMGPKVPMITVLQITHDLG